ncbi:uncharacterized protein LOC122466142 isoform X2 [Chelonia mydas]|uniref:uncharacterized protein LOC122466142 isoform X2 n=1 Tax=Chelonia mydas TaxID=8469 RepID=UPI001CA8F00A|nr:uncharacterized protein LOC122466142 isoform X2 [Chelonia mydas]
MHTPPEMCLCGAVLALCCTAAAAWLQVSVGPSPGRGRPGQRVVLESLFGAGDPPLDRSSCRCRGGTRGARCWSSPGRGGAGGAGGTQPGRGRDPSAPPDACPLGGGAPRLRQLEEAIGGCVRSASELQGHLAWLAAEVKRCLGSPEAEERPPRAEAASANRTAQA